MKLTERLYFRAKNFVEKQNLKKCAQRNGVFYKDIQGVSLGLIETMETVKNYLRQSETLIDVGAHKGLFTKVANIFFSFSHSICFEPNTSLHDQIRENNKEISLRIEDVALSSLAGHVPFYLHGDQSMSSLIPSNPQILRDEFPWDNPDVIKSMTVDAITLDEYMQKNGFFNKRIFLKIDTQGNEIDILRSGERTLMQTEVCVIEHMFTSPYETESDFFELLSLMKRNSFDCLGALSVSKRPSKKISAVDFIFVNSRF